MENIDVKALLKTTLVHKASDLHLLVGSEPQIRIDGHLVKLDLPPITQKSAEDICYSILTEEQKRVFEETKELDFAVTIPEFGRFRVNYYISLGNIAAAFRMIPTNIPSLDDLDSPPIYKELINREKGLILVTGPTGSGKTTTVAAMLNEINNTISKHILCIEDPVEFVHKNNRCLFSYRTVGEDTKSFANALKASLREDPDVIYVGEMRDPETIGAALNAAETGHLVFGTLHTNSAAQTVNRIVSVFDGDKQAQVRAQLSVVLEGVISQSLIPKIGGGRVCIPEILIGIPAIGNLIRENKIHQIPSQMMIGQNTSGMQTQVQVLERCFKQGLITREDAYRYCLRPDELKMKIG
ncbi:MAG: type IV pilus twitching motility protein PilT [Wolinella sp.]